MFFTVLGSNETIIVVNQTNLGGGTQTNVLLLSGGVLTPLLPDPPVRGFQSATFARF